MKLTLNKAEVEKIVTIHLKQTLKLDFKFEDIILNDEDPDVLVGLVFSDEQGAPSHTEVKKTKQKVIHKVKDVELIKQEPIIPEKKVETAEVEKPAEWEDAEEVSEETPDTSKKTSPFFAKK